jgi:hypothetical protein
MEKFRALPNHTAHPLARSAGPRVATLMCFALLVSCWKDRSTDIELRVWGRQVLTDYSGAEVLWL